MSWRRGRGDLAGGLAQKFAGGGMKMAFVTDPDGYEVELFERQ